MIKVIQEPIYGCVCDICGNEVIENVHSIPEGWLEIKVLKYSYILAVGPNCAETGFIFPPVAVIKKRLGIT